jgi:tRNA(fMet)-specific endonuclease VapC
MSVFLLDTDTLSLLEQRHPLVLHRINSHPLSDIMLSAISIQEQMQGFLSNLMRARNRQQIAQAYDLLVMLLLPVWSHFRVLSFPETASLRFEQLRLLRLNVGLMDLRIAATALENNLTLVARNQRDFNRVPGLTTVDWSV